ncbi:hypothetical protein SAMN05216262_101538 [Colwellia chukchiensis]|uniref:Uncharacterized protein n=1 Tax=Colwellia chukchiensis TaxID=641665 RepID=A0A1H7HLF7_9GAMM|nr:hypothetical protein [Colwellia chukchiensis]SEK51203.1 hypothetical protein SAMN05216262_101538 [Colwellia chukchiensis]
MKKLKNFTTKMILPCLLVSGFVTAAEQEYSVMRQQLSIMSDIFKSSMADQSAAHGMKINRIDSTYLRGQGVVFTISSGAMGRQWHEYNFNFTLPELPKMPDIPAAPIAPEVNQEFHEMFDIDVNETVTQALGSAAAEYESVREALQQNREQARELREQQRDLAYSLREIAREKRDLSYQLARANDDDKAELEQALAKLAEKEKALQDEQQSLHQIGQEMAMAQKAKQAAKAKARSEQYQQLTQSLVATLCLYGNGLKALPSNEHVSIIVKSAGEKSERGYQDRIMVFSQKDIARCAKDSINAQTLMESANAYQF